MGKLPGKDYCKTFTVTQQVVEDYQRLFVNRREYTMQSHTASAGDRAALLLPAKQERDRSTHDADG